MNICVHPLYLILPATIACTMAFMLPASTPPYAIAFGTGKLKTIDSVSFENLKSIIFKLIYEKNCIFNEKLIYKFKF